MEVWNHPFRFLCIKKITDDMNHACITGEKLNVGIRLKSFIMCLVGAFCCFLQNCTALQFLKSSRLLLLEPTGG